MCFQLQYIAFALYNNIALRNTGIYYCHPNQELICVRGVGITPLSKLPRVTLIGAEQTLMLNILQLQFTTCKTEADKNNIDCIVNYLSCCSFLASCSRAWKSMDNNPTRLLTTSIPCKHLRIFFLWTVHLSLMSKGPQSDILTKHGKIGLRSASGNSERISTLTLAIASKMLALAIESWAISNKNRQILHVTGSTFTLFFIRCFCFTPEVQCHFIWQLTFGGHAV